MVIHPEREASKAESRFRGVGGFLDKEVL